MKHNHGVICTHGKVRYIKYKDHFVARFCGKPAVTVIDGIPACKKHAKRG